jgi:hypothetical protein
LHTFLSLDMVLCPVFIKVVLRLVIWYIQFSGEPGLYRRTSFFSFLGVVIKNHPHNCQGSVSIHLTLLLTHY